MAIFCHVDVGRGEQRPVFCQSHHRDGAGHVLGAESRPLQRIDGDVHLRPGPGAELLADIEHRRLVALAFADDHRAVDRQEVELAPHGVDGGLVGLLLASLAAKPGSGDGGALGHARQFEAQGAGDRMSRLPNRFVRHPGPVPCRVWAAMGGLLIRVRS